MNRKNQCFTCSKDFNKTRNVPKMLSCGDVICYECTIRLHQHQNVITCPWCHQDTNTDPLDLETVFLPDQQQMKTKECLKHKGQEKILFCQEDQEALCLVCVNFGDLHKGHTIKDIKEVIQKFKGNEFRRANKLKGAAQELLGKCKQSLYEEKINASENLDKYIVAITGQTEEIIKKVNQMKNQMMKSLMHGWKVIQQRYESEEQKIQNIEKLIECSQPEDKEDISELTAFVGKMKDIAKQVVNLKFFSVGIEYDQNINQILESLQDFARYKISKKEISIESKLLDNQQEELEMIEEFQQLRTIKYNSKVKKTYSRIDGQFNDEEQNIQETDKRYTQIEQFQEDGLIISGARSSNPNRFILNTINKSQCFQMKDNRDTHRTNWDRKNQVVYIISGYSRNGYVKECELFNMNTQSFDINPIDNPVEAFGSGLLDHSDLYIFGGKGSKGNEDKIQIYQSKINTWKTCQQILPNKSRATSALLHNRQAFLIYRNLDTMDTYTFDLHQITKHGEIFKGNTSYYTNTQPVQNQNFIYQFDGKSDLFQYDLANGYWNKI